LVSTNVARAREFYQSSAGFFEFLVEFCFSERVVCGGASRLMPAVANFLSNRIQNFGDLAIFLLSLLTKREGVNRRVPEACLS
jgi:hypothetical protein